MDIRGRCRKIFLDVLGVESSMLIDENWDRDIFLAPFYVRPAELLYLFYKIEAEFNLNINGEQIKKTRLNTLNSIYKLICESVGNT